MLPQFSTRQPYWRTLVLLARTPNLPGIWSNCLAGWLLSDGGSAGRLVLLLLGATTLYLGGAFLNDAFDAEFDRENRRERPIPAGMIGVDAVWRWGFAWLGSALVLWAPLGMTALVLGLVLVIAAVIYNALHQDYAAAPLLMAGCRFGLYLTGASAAGDVTGLAVWSGLALAFYVAGLGLFSRLEASPGAARAWPCSLLGAPVVLALIVNGGEYQVRGLVFSAALGFWVYQSLAYAFGPRGSNIGLAVSGLWAGIVLVDLLAVVGGGSGLMTLVFILLFALTVVLQRTAPAA